MTNITLRAVKVLFALVIGLVGVAAPGIAEPSSAGAISIQAACGDTSGFTKVNLSALPSQATDTVRLIQRGGPYPFPQDNGIFQNREKLLPLCSYRPPAGGPPPPGSAGYYREYTVKTPGSSTRGARRIVKGNGNEYFYTADHYASFRLVNINA